MNYLMVAKNSNIKNNGWKGPADEESISHRTWKCYIKKLSDNFTSNMLRTGWSPPALIPF